MCTEAPPTISGMTPPRIWRKAATNCYHSAKYSCNDSLTFPDGSISLSLKCGSGGFWEPEEDVDITLGCQSKY